MPEQDKNFTPSYAASTQPEYVAVVAECAPYAGILDWTKRMSEGAPPYCKRELHRMMQGGRRSLRYPDAGWSGGNEPGVYPPDPRHGGPKAVRWGRPPMGTLPVTLPGEREGKPEGEKTQQRLDGPNPHFHARTQPFADGKYAFASLIKGLPVRVGDLKITLIDTVTARDSMEADETSAVRATVEQDGNVVAVSTFNRQPVDIGDKRLTFYVSGNRTAVRVASSGKVARVREAIERYMESQGTPTAFVLPSHTEPLIRAGMPRDIAHFLLTRRRPKHGLPVSYEKADKKPFDLITFINDEVGGLTVDRFRPSLKVGRDSLDLAIVADNSLLLSKVLYTSTIKGQKVENEMFSQVSFQEEPIKLVAVDINKAFEAYVAKVKAARTYEPANDDAFFIQDLLRTGVGKEIETLSADEAIEPDSKIVLLFRPRGETNTIKRLETLLDYGEHSKLRAVAPRAQEIRYKGLTNVTLEELPSLLVRLAARKQRKGRRLPQVGSSVKSNPHSRSNQSMSAQPQPSLRKVTLDYVFDNMYNNPNGPELVPVLDAQGNPVADRVYWPETKYRSFRESSGVSVKRRVPVRLKEVDVAQARSWMKIAEVGKAVRKDMSKIATAQMATLTPVPTSQPTTSLGKPATLPTRKNPMDDDFWLYQYSKSPYGAERDLPAARRNPEDAMYEEEEEEFESLDNPRKKKRKKRKARAASTALVPARRPARRAAAKPALPAVRDASAVRAYVGKRTQQLLRSHGCSLKQAMSQAWAEVKGKPKAKGGRSRSNPWYDSLYLPDTTVVGPALVRATYPWDDGTMVRSDLVPGPYTKSNPESQFEASPEPALWEYHPVFDQTAGQFSTGESFTRGVQPMNRRNPGMVARFPSKCAKCGRAINRGDHIRDSGKRGPRGGVLMAHDNCGR